MDVVQCAKPVNRTTTGDITTTPGRLLGWYVNSTTAGTIVIRDGGSGGTVISGTITPAIGWHAFPAESQTTLGFHATIGGTLDVTFFAK